MSKLVEKSVAEAGSHGFGVFDSIVQDQYELLFETTSVAVRDLFGGMLRSVFGSSPAYYQLIGRSTGVRKELTQHVTLSASRASAVACAGWTLHE